MTWLVATAVAASIGFVVAWSIMMRRIPRDQRREVMPDGQQENSPQDEGA